MAIHAWGKSLAITFAVSVSVIGGANLSVSANSQSQSLSWVNSSLGKSYDFDHAYGVQCFDYVNQYAQTNFGTHFSGGVALDLMKTGNVNGFKVIHKTGSAIPQAGDIVVFDVSGNGVGHTGVVISANSSSITWADENFNNVKSTVKHTATYASLQSWGMNIVGWVRPPFTNGSTTNPGNSGSNTGNTSNIQVGSVVTFPKVYKISKVDAAHNLVASDTLSGGASTANNWIDPTPLTKTNASGVTTANQTLAIGDYAKVTGKYSVLKVDKPSNGIQVKMGSRTVWLSASQAVLVK